MSSLVNLRGEFVYRILGTDYLDDVSTSYIDPNLFAANGLTGAQLNNALQLHDRQINSITGPGGKRGSPAEKDAFFTFQPEDRRCHRKGKNQVKYECFS
ncbi:MAG: hypothetical protein V9E88_02865 [Ferruginibacter sp.]